jgi:hypothetical protein
MLKSSWEGGGLGSKKHAMESNVAKLNGVGLSWAGTAENCDRPQNNPIFLNVYSCYDLLFISTLEAF